jgi:hypothetical protein
VVLVIFVVFGPPPWRVSPIGVPIEDVIERVLRAIADR